ncbi:hypothetical protein [Confluentibacter flavum]|uniref:Uncharacterized protein n=1 Tax=Confluentibacter flavum TaxID=1909700 RepID=A0A2N3HPY7_9FLAO|nr:hypothetical protein [Confluentibacter flavum]PKQ47001.1 hypothetical protein CSW08_00085 [Confluentibacter flavum]
MSHSHTAGEPLSGSGITLSAALSKNHAQEEQVSSSLPIPGGSESVLGDYNGYNSLLFITSN